MTNLVVIQTGIFLAVFFGTIGLMEAIIVRKNLNTLKKQTTALYREDAYKETGPLQRIEAWFNRSEYGEEVENTLKGANIKLSPFRWMLIYVGSWLGISYLNNVLLSLEFPYNFLIAYLFLKLGVSQWLQSRKSKLVQKVNEQLPEVCRLMGSCVRAGLSLPQSIEIVGNQIKPPCGELFKNVSRELRMGMVLDVVLNRLSQRVKSKDLNLINNTIIIQRKAGGNLSQALDNMAKTLEERERVNQELRNSTSESRYVALILTFLPVFIVVMFNMLFEGFIMPLFTLPGVILLVVVVILIGTGLLIIRQISNIKV